MVFSRHSLDTNQNHRQSAMAEWQRERGGPPSRKSARLEQTQKARQPPSSAPIPNQRPKKDERSQVLRSPSTSGSAGEHHRQTQPPEDRTKTSTHDTDCESDFGKTPVGSVTRRKRKRDGEPTPSGEQLRGTELAESSEQREQFGEITPKTCIPQSSDTPERDLGVSEENEESKALDTISYWAAHRSWPDNFARSGPMTSTNNPRVPGRGRHQTSQETSNTRKSESPHRSSILDRMAANGVFMKSSAQVQESSKNLCSSFLAGDRAPQILSSFSADKLADVLEFDEDIDEGQVQMDVTPWIVPSARNLFLCGELDIDYIGVQAHTLWTKCATMGSTRPEPNVVVGLLGKAFTKDEIQKLRNYASPATPFFFTPKLCFPFLICEVKCGEEGLSQANRQNIHSGSIAVRAIIVLYKAAFGETDARVKELYGKVLAFTVSHNSSIVRIFGHYALATEGSADKLEFYRYEIAVFSLIAFDGADRFRPYNFVCNVYDKFAPEHLKRIKDAAARLPDSGAPSEPSVPTSEMELETDAQTSSQEPFPQDEDGSRKPALPSDALLRREIDLLKDQMKQMEQRQEQRGKLMEQREKEKEQSEVRRFEEFMSLLKDLKKQQRFELHA